MTTHEEEGFTLVELVITLLLLSIVSFMLLNFLDSTTKLTNRANLHSLAEQDGQLALRTLTQDLRSANPIIGSCGGSYADCIQFDVQRPSAANRTCEKTTFTYRVVAGTLTRTKTVTNWASTTCAAPQTATYPLLGSMVNSSVTPAVSLFTYFDRNGAVLNPATQASLIPQKPSAGGAASVKVSFVVRYQTRSPELRLSGSVSLRNNR
ncbi:MAG TPA: prepilin-type N-terminal cleavage/methylation domain-containing protein [Acidimicrobiales bacterium]|nr:prepilin-type N-terminal cleavage/methylation domain-containing protein [Acidimicrobiales bacterium]